MREDKEMGKKRSRDEAASHEPPSDDEGLDPDSASPISVVLSLFIEGQGLGCAFYSPNDSSLLLAHTHVFSDDMDYTIKYSMFPSPSFCCPFALPALLPHHHFLLLK